MRLLLIFVSACVALATVKIAVTVLALLLLITLVWGACLHPKEMAGLFALCACLSLIKAYPGGSLLIAGLTLVGCQILMALRMRS